MQEISERKPEKNHMVELSKQQQLIIEILKHYPHLKAFEIMQKLGDQQPARRTLLDDLFILKKLGIVDSHGHTRSIV